MGKKIILIILVFTMLIQLAIPVGMIVYSQKVETDFIENGFEYKFKIKPWSMTDGTLNFMLEEKPNYWDKEEYGVVTKDLGGYAYFKVLQDEKPMGSNYIHFNAENKVKMRTFETDSTISLNTIAEDDAYAVIKVHNGNLEIIEVYIDNLPVKEWAEKESEKDITINDDYVDFDKEIVWEE